MIYTIAAFYRFTPLSDLPAVRAKLVRALPPLGLCGTLLLAPEGINGTLAGTAEGIEVMLGLLAIQTGLTRDEVKFSEAAGKPFARLKIRLKREIITFNQPAADPNQRRGNYVEARDWNALIADAGVTVIDTRNRYETMIGTFRGAQDPQIDSFTEFADYVRANLSPEKNRKIAMFCTGGIRCEKASAFMLSEGYQEVYHLKGGILKYLEQIPENESKWDGACYVFDRRVGVGHGLNPEDFAMCFSCGYPLAAADRQHELFEEGVSCAHCHATTASEDKARFRMRQQQLGA